MIGRRTTFTVLVAALAVATPAAAGRRAPRALYNALLASHVSGTTATPTQAGAVSKRHHVVGEMLFDFGGGRSRIAYVVFPTHADALGNYADGVSALKKLTAVRKVVKNVAGLPKPSVRVDASQNGLGVTQITFVSENVELVSQSIQLNAKTGNEKLARKLAGLALTHLRAIEKSA